MKFLTASLSSIRSVFKADLTFGGMSAIAAMLTLMLAQCQTYNEERKQDYQRFQTIIADLSNPTEHPELTSALARGVLVGEIDGLIDRLGDRIPPEQLFLAGNLTKSNFPNAYALAWYELALKRIMADPKHSAVSELAAHWYLGTELLAVGNTARGNEEIRIANELAAKMPPHERKTLLAQIQLSLAGVAYLRDDLAQCELILNQVRDSVRADGNWYRIKDLQDGSAPLNDCKPFVATVTPVPGVVAAPSNASNPPTDQAGTR